MSSPPLRSDGLSPGAGSPVSRATRLAGTARNRLPHLARSLLAAVTRPARAMAFWTAIALPFLNAALLVEGLSTPSETVTFLAILAVNVLALLVGHPHRRD